MSDHNALDVRVTWTPKDGWRYRCDSMGAGYSGWQEFHPDSLPLPDSRLLLLMVNHIAREAWEHYYKDKGAPEPPKFYFADTLSGDALRVGYERETALQVKLEDAEMRLNQCVRDKNAVIDRQKIEIAGLRKELAAAYKEGNPTAEASEKLRIDNAALLAEIYGLRAAARAREKREP